MSLSVYTPKCFMYLLEMLHRMLTQLIKFGLVLEMFCGNTLLNLLQPFTVDVVVVCIGGVNITAGSGKFDKLPQVLKNKTERNRSSIKFRLFTKKWEIWEGLAKSSFWLDLHCSQLLLMGTCNHPFTAEGLYRINPGCALMEC